MTYPIAYQLYSSRNFPPLEAQLPELKAMGYDAIEPWLPAYEADPQAFRSALDANGLKCFGFHMPLAGLTGEPDRLIEIALTLGPPILYCGGSTRQPDKRPLTSGLASVKLWPGALNAQPCTA